MSSITSYIILAIVIPSLMFALPTYQNIQTPFRNAEEAVSAAVYICKRWRFFFELTEGGDALFAEAFGTNGQLFVPSSEIWFDNNQAQQTVGYTAIKDKTVLIRNSLSFQYNANKPCDQALTAATVNFTDYTLRWTAHHQTHLEQGSHEYERIESNYFIGFNEDGTGTVDILVPSSDNTIDGGKEEFWDMCYDFEDSTSTTETPSAKTGYGNILSKFDIAESTDNEKVFMFLALVLGLLSIVNICFCAHNCMNKRHKYQIVTVDSATEFGDSEIEAINCE